MQTLSTLLVTLANIGVLLNSMQNRGVASYLASRVKATSDLMTLNPDFFCDVADTCEDYCIEATPNDFCPEDIDRLHTLCNLLHDANKALFNAQNEILGV